MEDITYYEKILKENIQRVEENRKDKEALNIIQNAFESIFEYIKLFLVEKKERYYGYILMNMRLQIAYDRPFPAAVNTDTNPFTIIFNPLFMAEYSLKEMVYIVCHEIEHLVLDHPSEGIKLNQTKNPILQYRLNLCMDASVNDRLNMEIEKYNLNMMSTPDDAVTSRKLSRMFYKKLMELQSFLHYYKIIKGIVDEEDPDDGNPNNGIPMIPGKDGKPIDKDSIVLIVNGRNPGGVIMPNDVKGKEIVSVWTEGDSSSDSNEKIKHFIKEVMDGIPDDCRGLFPGYQQEAIQRLLSKPVINWSQVLKKYIGLIPNSYRKTKMRINRRQPERFDIPGRMNNRTIKVVVAIDTSASVSEFELREIFAEIFGILKNLKYELTIIECDAKIQKIYKARTIRDVNFVVNGRGETAYTPVIEYINESGKYKDAVLIYFTDGEGDFEIPKPKTYRNLWVVFDDADYLSIREPYGEVIGLKRNE